MPGMGGKGDRAPPPPPPLPARDQAGGDNAQDQNAEALWRAQQLAAERYGVEQSVEEREAADREREFGTAVRRAMPRMMRDKMESRLVPEEWDAEVRDARDIDARGGVALVKKNDVPEVLERVGVTLRPTAILVSQPGHELGPPPTHPPGCTPHSVCPPRRGGGTE